MPILKKLALEAPVEPDGSVRSVRFIGCRVLGQRLAAPWWLTCSRETPLEPAADARPGLCAKKKTRQSRKPLAREAKNGAGYRVRTGDIQLGKLAFYQLNYARDNVAPIRLRACCFTE